MKPDGMLNWIGALVVLAVLAMGVAAILALTGCEEPAQSPCDAIRTGHVYEYSRLSGTGLWEHLNVVVGGVTQRQEAYVTPMRGGSEFIVYCSELK